MQRLFPSPMTEVEAYEAYRPADPGAPLLRVNMVSSLDGHVVDAGGVSGGLGGAADATAFFAMRHLADGIVAGAGTVRAEGYGPMRVRRSLEARRAEDGRPDPAAIVVVTRGVDLDLTAPLFTEAVVPTVVLTCAAAPADRIDAVREAGGVVVQTGGRDVDLVDGVARLRDMGLQHLLVEGGPTLNSQLLAADLVDELCLTLAPVVAGGTDLRRVVSPVSPPVRLELAQVLHADGELLLSYRRPAGRSHPRSHPQVQ